MTKQMKTAAKGIAGVLSAFVLAAALTACGGGKTTLAGDWVDDTTYTITADNAKDDDMFMIGYEIADGTTALAITSDMEKGVLHIALTEGASVDESDEEPGEDASVDEVIDSVDFDFEEGESIFTVEAEGAATEVVDVEPGSYMLVVSGDDDAAATGTVTIAPAE